MGFLGELLDNTVRRTKDNLTYKAENAATDAIIKTVEKGVDKVKGQKEAIKRLEKCPKCKASIEYGAKFCPECGQTLTISCNKCNTDYPIGTKFCQQCGKKLN